jgi:hypothetical protein
MATARGVLDTAVFEEPELWRASLATAFSDLVPGQLDREPPPEGTLSGGHLGPTAVFTAARRRCGGRRPRSGTLRPTW